MNRFYLLQCMFFCLLSFQSNGQESDDLLNWKSEYTLRTHLLQKMHKQYDLRRADIDRALESKESMVAYRNECRQKYHSLLGQFPEKSAMNPQITKRTEMDGYRIENILFESLPKHHVAANFYLPDGGGTFPAVLLFCGHEMTSKATESYQKTAALFAKNGFAVLVVDPISQGEMVQFTDINGKRILRGSTTEHTLLNAGANLVGTNVVTYELVDNVRSLDYLLSRPEVDADRIGCLGNSGGGTQTAFFIGFDERVKVAAPCSFIARRERNYELTGAADGCQLIPSEGEALLEIGDYLIMFAPKPVLILAGRYDFVDYVGTEETAVELQSVYSLLGEPEKFEMFTVDDGHGISKPKREEAVRWFRRWLCNDNSVIAETSLEVLSEQTLNCTPNGQINDLFSDERNIQEINLEKGGELEENRRQFADANDLSGYQKQIKKLLAIDDTHKIVTAELLGEESHDSYLLKKIILRTVGEIPLPCLVYLPAQRSTDATLDLYLMESGKAGIAANDSLIKAAMQLGNVMVLADLPGMGETLEREDANDPKYYNREYNNAIISLHLGEPLVGLRVAAIFTLLDFIEEEKLLIEAPVHVYASGAAGPASLYAALFRTEIHSVQLTSTIQSYFDILHMPVERDWYSYVIPNVLKYFDLPDLIKVRDDLKVSMSRSIPMVSGW